MKKLVAVLLCGALMSSLILSGCGKAPDVAIPSETTTVAATEATAKASETKPAETEPSRPDINMDNLLKAADYYSSHKPGDDQFINIYIDGIRGGGSYIVTADLIDLTYTGTSDYSTFKITVDRANRSISVTFDLYYGKTRLYGTGETSLWGLESFVDQILSNAGTYELYDGSALTKNPDAVKKDLPILYARFIKMADNAFPELGIGLEDLGIELGDKYRDVDPTQNMSFEKYVKNSHKYTNGVCTDCKKLWIDYYRSAIATLTNRKKGYLSVYGQNSSSMFDTSDYVQCSSLNKNSGEVYFQHCSDVNKVEVIESCTVTANRNKKALNISMLFDLDQKRISMGKGVNGYKHHYRVSISAKAGNYKNVFASKEAFKKNAKVELYVFNKKGTGKNAWTKKADINKLKKNFEADKCTYYTKDQILDYFWDHHEAILKSMDNGMVWLDTNLTDMGVNWKG